VPVRIGDINYGGHVGNDAILSIMHEARMQWLAQLGYTEMETVSHGLIMADVMIAYRAESFYGDVLEVSLYADSVTGRSFDLLYKLTTKREGQEVLVAEGKTGMICFDYSSRKIVQMSEGLRKHLA
jgi:YbgC/YbaW family acyl-CoA thioester hydrolase